MTSATLLLRLAAPLQSWGASSSYSAYRDTAAEPTKSGVLGLLAAALGLPRDCSGPQAEARDRADFMALTRLRFGVRVDQPGHLLRDYHTVSPLFRTGRLPTASGTGRKAGEGIITERYYLSDAAFLAAVEGEDREFLDRLDKAVHAPRWQLFLGRRSCPPTPPISLGITELGVEEALRTTPAITRRTDPTRLRIVVDDPSGDDLRQDQPTRYGVGGSVHALRRTSIRYVTPPLFTEPPWSR